MKKRSPFSFVRKSDGYIFAGLLGAVALVGAGVIDFVVRGEHSVLGHVVEAIQTQLSK